jgi:hypothetical protein
LFDESEPFDESIDELGRFSFASSFRLLPLNPGRSADYSREQYVWFGALFMAVKQGEQLYNDWYVSDIEPVALISHDTYF